MTKNRLLLLSGTPASGKDTITKALCNSHLPFQHFRKHKSARTGKTDSTYIFVDQQQFDAMAARQEFVQYHYRYERGYGVSKQELERIWQRDGIPIIHVGKYENIQFFTKLSNVEITNLLLLTSRQETQRRLEARHGNDRNEIGARLRAYEEERNELADLIRSGRDIAFSGILNNSELPPEDAANLIVRMMGI